MYFIYFHCCQKFKQELGSSFPHQSEAGIFSKLKLHFNQCFSDPDAKEIFIFQNPFNSAIKELPPNLQLGMINLQCNDMLKGKISEECNKIL